METKVYYIKGSSENPEDVKQALINACPDVKNIHDYKYNTEECIYYILDNVIYYTNDSLISAKLVKKFGTELQPKKQEKFVEKTMYQRIFKDELEDLYKDIYGSSMYFSTIEEAMAGQETIGYKEVKIMVKE